MDLADLKNGSEEQKVILPLLNSPSLKIFTGKIFVSKLNKLLKKHLKQFCYLREYDSGLFMILPSF